MNLPDASSPLEDHPLTANSGHFTPAECAAICGLRSFDVQNAINRGIVTASLGSRPGGRGKDGPGGRAVYLKPEDLVWMRIWKSIGETLCLRHRLELWSALSADSGTDHVRLSDLLLVDVAEARRQVSGRLADLEAARDIVSKGTGDLAGEIVFKGTRILVYATAARIKAGQTQEDLLKSEPSLTERTLDLGMLWATAYPRRGRPSRLSRRAQRQ